jgi:hypothetical protein
MMLRRMFQEVLVMASKFQPLKNYNYFKMRPGDQLIFKIQLFQLLSVFPLFLGSSDA